MGRYLQDLLNTDRDPSQRRGAVTRCGHECVLPRDGMASPATFLWEGIWSYFLAAFCRAGMSILSICSMALQLRSPRWEFLAR
jgi:hypothetical protein